MSGPSCVDMRTEWSASRDFPRQPIKGNTVALFYALAPSQVECFPNIVTLLTAQTECSD